MDSNEINKKLKQLKIEDYIWLLYLGIIVFSWYSNFLERQYYINNNLNAKKNYQTINKIIFTVLLIVYLYFFKGALEDIRNLKYNDSNKKKNLIYLSFIATLLLTISGTIFLYIAFHDDNLDVELAFN